MAANGPADDAIPDGLDAFSAEAFARAVPGSEASRALQAAMEMRVVEHLRAATEQAMDGLVAALGALGHAFVPDGEPGQLGFRSTAADGAVLSLVAHAGWGAAVAHRSAAQQQAEDAAPEREPRFYALAEAACAREAAVGFERLTADERRTIALYRLEAELANGGFDQYFRNSAGGHAALALEGLQEIGATRLHGLLARALEAFPGGVVPADRGLRNAAVDAVGAGWAAEWDGLASRWFASMESMPDLADRHAGPRD